MSKPPVDIVDRNRPLVVEVDEDRCDTCGARAYVYADFDTGSLAYCRHHGTKYWYELNRQANIVIDLRHHVLP